MAPVIQIPVKETFKTLHKVLKKRINISQVLKEMEKKVYTTSDY
jgi:hypothetical protein